MAPQPPEGTVALLFTDVQDSTRLARELGSEWPAVLAAHHDLVGGAIAAAGGHVEGTEGDAFFAVFASGAAGARAAVAAQRALRGHAWPGRAGRLRVRMGLHVGTVERGRTGYVGLEIHRAARVASAAHGGQLLLTRPAVLAAGDAVDAEPLGAFRLKDFPVPEPLFCARIDGEGAESFPPPRALDVRPTNLPAIAHALIGRGADLAAVTGALRRSRLVTLLGRGGVGKTSLALVAAAEALDAHAGGVWWVPLAAVSEAGAPAAVAAALHADAPGEPPLEAVVQRLEARGPTLLVLDNLEHVLGLRGWLGELLGRLEDLRLLLTSQAPLYHPAEHVVRLDVLPDAAALELFQQVAARSGRRLHPEELGDARQACRSVDGLPLAIELAAARLSVLTPRQLRERLAVSVDVVRGGRAAPDRQRSLGATLDWTLEQLDPEARSLFVRLGAFAGPVELAELEAVAGQDGLDVVEAAAVLVDFSLLARVETGDGRVRFGLPTALRTLAAARLGAAEDAHRWYGAHARRQLDLAWPARLPVMHTAEEERAAAEAEPEALLALDRAEEVAPEVALPLALAVGYRQVIAGRRGAGVTLLRAALTRPAGAHDRVVRAYVAYAAAAVAFFDGLPAMPHFDEALEILGDADQVLAASLLGSRSVWLSSAGDHTAAVAAAAAGSALVAQGNDPALAGALLREVQALIAAGDAGGARQRLDRAAEVIRRSGAAAGLRLDSYGGDLAYLEGRFTEALACFCRSVEAAQAHSDVQTMQYDLTACAGCLAALGADAAAAEVLGMMEALCASTGSPRDREQTLAGAIGADALLAAVERLGPAAADIRAVGAAVPPGQRVVRVHELAAAVGTAEPTVSDGQRLQASDRTT